MSLTHDGIGIAAANVHGSETDENEKVPATQQQCPERVAGTHCMRVCKVVFAHVGLALILIAYVIGGGYMFRALELSNEYSDCIQRQNNYRKTLNSSTARVIALAESHGNGNTNEDEVRDEMLAFARHVFSLDFHPDTNCSAIIHTSFGARWNVGNAMYFCVTIITTIGYGHIVPTTFWGKLGCVIYSTLGIPLMLIYLTVIGNGLARGFRFVYWNVICCRCFYDTLRLRRLRRKQRLIQWEQALQKHLEEKAELNNLPISPTKLVIEDGAEDVDEEPGHPREDLAVPLTISLIVLAGYIFIGGLLFPLWEEWSFADSVYFSFITLSTIGFGDLVLGAGRLHEIRTTFELAVGVFYMMLGLALLSMCLNLLQDEMLAKFQHAFQYFALCGQFKKVPSEAQTAEFRQEEEETTFVVLKAAVNFEKSKEVGSQHRSTDEEKLEESEKIQTASFANDTFEAD